MNTHVPGFQLFFRFFCIILYWPDKPPAGLRDVVSLAGLTVDVKAL